MGPDDQLHRLVATKGNARGISSGRISDHPVSELLAQSSPTVNGFCCLFSACWILRSVAYRRVSAGISEMWKTPLSQPEHPHQRVQRYTQVAQILVRPTRRVLVGANSAVDDQRRPAASCERMFPVTLVESAVASSNRLLSRSMASSIGSSASCGNALADQDAGDRGRARQGQAHRHVMAAIEVGERKPPLGIASR